MTREHEVLLLRGPIHVILIYVHRLSWPYLYEYIYTHIYKYMYIYIYIYICVYIYMCNEYIFGKFKFTFCDQDNEGPCSVSLRDPN